MNEEEKRSRIKRENMLIFLVLYLGISIFIIRLSMFLNSGHELNLEILDKTMKSLKAKPFILPRTKDDLKVFMLFSFSYGIFILDRFTKNEKYMVGKEYGSAEWGKPGDFKKFIDKEDDKNIILTKTEKFSINSRKTMRNNNILVVGGSGTGKTRFVLKPNLMQMHSSYVITDPKGEILRDTGNMLERNGYKIRILNLYELNKSNKYNPFNYIRSEKDILKLINNLIKNTNPSGSSGGSDPFWEKSETALLQSLFAFIWKYVDESEQNFGTVLRLLELIEVREEDESFKSEMDIIMDHYNEKDPNNFAYRQWLIFKQAGGKTAKSILISTGVRLSVFNISDLENLTSRDELELDKMGDEKTALFILISDSDSTLNFLASMLYQQLFEELYFQADFVNEGSLKYQVRCLIDEFANIGQIPEFEKKLATMRSRGISSTIIIQNTAQLEALYKDHWKTIIGNCDTFLYLGGIEQSSHEYVSKLLGKGTIDNKTRGKTKGRQSSTNENFQRLGRELLMPDEVGALDNKKCILFFRGLSPYLSDKFPLEKHRRYKELFDEDTGKNRFNFEVLGAEELSYENFQKEYREDLYKIEEEIESETHGISENLGRDINKLVNKSQNKLTNKQVNKIEELEEKLESKTDEIEGLSDLVDQVDNYKEL